MKFLAFVLAGAFVVSSATASSLAAAKQSVRGSEILRHIRTLASDEFEGRAPGTAGEQKTIDYISGEMKKNGLTGPYDGGSYVQEVPLVGQIIRTSGSMSVKGRPLELRTPEDFVAATRRVESVAIADSEIVFVGYGVVAPEYGWDDYKDVDVRGKTIIMLVGDPPVPDSRDRTKLDLSIFKGEAMTYYGRWTYKYEIAAKKGAAAAIIVHETGPAGYPYSTIVSGRTRERLQVREEDGGRSWAAVEAWMTVEKTRALLAAAGHDFDALKRAALRSDFRPVALDARASFDIEVTSRELASRNVIGVLEGSDPELKDECVVYMAHWDAFGVDPNLSGDQIKNGALDNASGVAEMLEIARAFTKLSKRPKRTIVFIAPTAEESNLLGAAYYVENPLFPMEKTVAVINMDMMNLWGRTRSIVSIGYPNSTLEDLLAELAKKQGRRVKPDPEPEKGFFYRSDHLEFMKRGVPALTFLHSGLDYIGKPNGFGMRKRREYNERDYHRPSDEVKKGWQLGGAVEDVRLLFEVGYRVAQSQKWPEWKAGTEFKAIREGK